MNLKNLSIIYFSVTAFIIVSIFPSLIIDYIPESRGEPFFSLALLGKEELAENYYPGEEPIIYLETLVKWNIYIYNHMGETQQIKVKIKLMNSDTTSPNTTTCTPSPTTEIFEIRKILLKNETLVIPYEWSIRQIVEKNGSYQITLMQINNYMVNTSVNWYKGDTLKMVFELWVYEEIAQEFFFGWSVLGDKRCVWNQIHFNIDV